MAFKTCIIASAKSCQAIILVPSYFSFSRQIKNHQKYGVRFWFNQSKMFATIALSSCAETFVYVRACDVHILKWFTYLRYMLTLSKYKRFRTKFTLKSNVCVERIEAHKFYDTKKYKMMCNVNPSQWMGVVVFETMLHSSHAAYVILHLSMSFEHVSIVEWRTANSMNCKSKRITSYRCVGFRIIYIFEIAAVIVTQFQRVFLLKFANAEPWSVVYSKYTMLCILLCTLTHTHTYKYPFRLNGKFDFLRTFNKVSTRFKLDNAHLNSFANAFYSASFFPFYCPPLMMSIGITMIIPLVEWFACVVVTIE